MIYSKEDIQKKLDKMIPNPVCELNYKKDYELLIATVLAAQSTDKRVNIVTKVLFDKYDIFKLAEAKVKDIESIIKSVGTYFRKSIYCIEIAKSLVANYKGKVPNNREYLESLPGVGRKTTNVVLSEIYDVPTIAVDTHVSRTSIRLELADQKDDVLEIEKKLMKIFPETKWSRIHKQLVLFGRYKCTAKNMKCDECLFNKECKYKRVSS